MRSPSSSGERARGVQHAGDLPDDRSYDKRYVFEAVPTVGPVRVFVYDSGFGLHPSAEGEFGRTQRAFWEQVNRLTPHAYVAQGDNFN